MSSLQMSDLDFAPDARLADEAKVNDPHAVNAEAGELDVAPPPGGHITFPALINDVRGREDAQLVKELQL